MPPPETLVRESRQSAGLTQHQLGQRLGMTQSAIAKLEQPGVNPTVETLDRVLRATGTRLHLTASPFSEGVDDTLIAAELRTTPEERILSAKRLFAFGRSVFEAGARSRGELA